VSGLHNPPPSTIASPVSLSGMSSEIGASRPSSGRARLCHDLGTAAYHNALAGPVRLRAIPSRGCKEAKIVKDNQTDDFNLLDLLSDAA